MQFDKEIICNVENMQSGHKVPARLKQSALSKGERKSGGVALFQWYRPQLRGEFLINYFCST